MRPLSRGRWAFGTAIVLIACAAPPTTGGTAGLSIAYPAPGQTLSGTVGLAAAAFGGAPTGLRFTVAGAAVDARADGTAYLDTRDLPDGDHLLRAEAVVAGTEVANEIPVRVDNDLTDAASVGLAGGSLRTASGSIATLPPGALASNAQVSVRDATQEGILDEFGVDYPALGVTFLGALEIDTGGAEPALPIAVDLVGWAPAVQPGRQVVMFVLAPDADGDGVGELMFASDAEATSTGSVITRPVPQSEVIGFGAAGGLTTLQASGVRPGQIVTVSARGFNPLASLANAARYGPTSAPTAETLLAVRVADSAAFNPLLEVRFAVPALGAGSHAVRLHNLTTGYRAEPLTVGLLAPGSAPASTWTGFVAQLEAAADRLTLGRADLAALAAGWRAALVATDPALPAAMAANSGLVSAANLAALQQIAAGGATAAQRDLVIRHALVLDAIASSLTGTPAAAAADFATLLVVTAHASRAGSSALNLLQAGDDPSCTGTASTGTGISWGSSGAPTTTGMGDGPPSTCADGNVVGANGGAASALDLGPAELATSSLRRGGFRPVAGALVKVFRPGTDVALAPFTAFTDATGTFRVPFIAPGEPFTIRALDPVTLQVAEADGVARAVGFSTPVSLMFTSTAQGPGAPTASFVIRPVPDARFAGTVYYEFDASGSSDDGTIASYVWDFGGFLAEVEWTDTVVRGYGRNATYDIRLTVIDDDGLAGTTTRQLVIDDLPHDYWGLAPELITVGPNGEILDDTALWTNLALSRDGRYAAFATTATNLDPADVNALPDVYLKDMETGAVELVSSGAANEAVGSFVALSADARFVAYGAATSQINPRIEIVDRQAGTTEIVLPAGGLSRITLIALSDDGRVVLFESSALSGPPRHLYVKDLETDVLTRVGLELDGTTYAAQATGLGLSGDGDTVVFRSTSSALVPGDTNGVEDLFAYRRSTGATVRVSEAADGTQADRGSRARGRVVTHDGRYVTFWSEATTFPHANENDAPGLFDRVYVKDLVTGALTLVSTNATGVLADDDAVLPTISDDGRYVAFGTYASNLAPEMDQYDGNCDLGMCNLGLSYVKDTVTGRVMLVTVGLNDTLPDDWDQIEPTISGDGRYVGFYSWATNLVEGSVDGSVAYYYRAVNPLWAP